MLPACSERCDEIRQQSWLNCIARVRHDRKVFSTIGGVFHQRPSTIHILITWREPCPVPASSPLLYSRFRHIPPPERSPPRCRPRSECRPGPFSIRWSVGRCMSPDCHRNQSSRPLPHSTHVCFSRGRG